MTNRTFFKLEISFGYPFPELKITAMSLDRNKKNIEDFFLLDITSSFDSQPKRSSTKQPFKRPGLPSIAVLPR